MKNEIINGKDRVEHVQINVSINAKLHKRLINLLQPSLINIRLHPLDRPVIQDHLIVRTSKRTGISTIRIVESRDAGMILAINHVYDARYR
jgi:hypothetical protein